MRLWDDHLEGLRPTIRSEAQRFIETFPGGDPGTGPAVERVEARRRAEQAMVLRSEKGSDRVVAGVAGPIRLRQFVPEQVDGVMLHIHGGGWITGEPALTDLLHEALCENLQLAIVSVEYRLAPEHPYPAAPDDCEAAALWVAEHAVEEYGSDRLLIGGESAGAHLSAVTLLRLRDRHDLARRFVGANLVFGAYDLSMTPSASGIRVDPGGDMLGPEDISFMTGQFLPGLTIEERRNPDISPLYADLTGMPPALFTVGGADHLVDDTLFFADRWRMAGNRAELLVYPEAPHGCIGLPTVMDHWWPRLEVFLRRSLEEPTGSAVPAVGSRTEG